MTDDALHKALLLLETPPPPISEAEATDAAHRHYGLVGRITPLAGERDRNFLLRPADGPALVLKFSNPEEDETALALQIALLRHIERERPALAVPRLRPTLTGADMTTVHTAGGAGIALHALTLLPGFSAQGVPSTEALRRNIGGALGELALSLAGFRHPGAERVLLWDIMQAPGLRAVLSCVRDPGRRAFIGDFLDRFEADLSPRLARLRRQVIHNDLSSSNLMLASQDAPSVTGILDFGDAVLAPLVNDLAVAASYHLQADGRPLDAVAGMVEAYEAAMPLRDEERALLPDLILARIVVRTVINEWRGARFPENRAYIERNMRQAWTLLDHFMAMPDASRRDLAARSRPGPGLPAPENLVTPETSSVSATGDLVARRRRLLGPAYRLLYEEPIHPVRGEGVWLYDAEGNAFLDAYNNVPSVGHSHPRVVAALAEQAARLNTHTRYLHETVLNYAEALLATFPDEIGHVMLTCTGSEANDLAVRAARVFTGGTGFVVTRFAYHGVTAAVAEMSPSLGAGVALGPDVRTVAAPDTFRQTPAEAAARFEAEVRAAVADMAAHGIRPAALLFDTVFASDGVFPATGIVDGGIAAMRAAGGLYIADEVQAGLARTGSHMWGFERHGVVPDLVTFGKPMGNGHPIAGMAAKPAILTEFGQKTRYFNTFGGNPVSAAVGLAVLDVVRDEGLMANAAQVGAHLMDGLRALQQRHEVLGDIRGAGLYVGIEIVDDDGGRSPSAARTTHLVNGLRRRGVLVGISGMQANVIKVRPPLPFSRANADLFLDRLDACLGE